jgi:hypothetical protein
MRGRNRGRDIGAEMEGKRQRENERRIDMPV